MADFDKQKIEITFKSPGACPPVYVSGAFTDPPWQVCEMKYHIMIGNGATESASLESREYLFYKQFQVSEGRWQYKFRLGPGDWWVCDEDAEIVTDEAGNRNNLLVVTPSHSENACAIKRVHARPLARSTDSSQDSAWESVELNPPPYTDSKGLVKGNHQSHCHIKGHFNPNCSREGRVEDEGGSFNPIKESESMSGQAYEPQRAPQYLHSMASAAYPNISKLTIPSLSIQEADTLSENSKNSSDKEGFGDRKMSNIDIEKVKLLMSIPSPSGLPTSIMAVHDGDIVALDNNYGVSRSSPGLIERTNSHAPLLPHECLTCEDIGYEHHDGRAQGAHTPLRHPGSSNPESTHGPLTPDDLDDLNDPNLELFPSDAQNILQRIATLHKDLAPDETVAFDYESPFGSPARFTKDAPTFAHELPPIGSPADARRKMSSYGSPDCAIHTDGSSDTHLRHESHSPIDTFRLPPSHSFEDETMDEVDEENRRDSVRQSFAETKELDTEEQPLIDPPRTSQKEVTTYETLLQSSPPSEGTRLRSARTAELISSTEDSSSESDDKGHFTRSFWQKVLDWFTMIWAAALGRKHSS
ncbi:hypothetical protein MMC11_002310 [Xylographa trunciseda]|nr:hypothetical protein [Xylographa trunciseda]